MATQQVTFNGKSYTPDFSFLTKTAGFDQTEVINLQKQGKTGAEAFALLTAANQPAEGTAPPPEPGTEAWMKAEIARLTAANAKLKSAGVTANLSMKVSEKGGLSVYGLGRFPVTLYKEQWTRLLDKADDVRKFMELNQASLKSKGDA